MSRLNSNLKWFYPGMYVKRYAALAFIGVFIFLIGVGVINQIHRVKPPLAVRAATWVISLADADIHPGTLGLLLTIIGALICLLGIGKLISSLTSAVDPEMSSGGLVEVIYNRRRLSQGKRIVVIGGGTGLSTLLRGLKRYSSNITAIVTVADDGGSSGKIRKQLNILPPGDIRSCLVALADAEPQMTQLFQYRFRNSSTNSSDYKPGSEGYGEGLRDHAFGNLLIAAMCAVCGGDFEQAVLQTSRVLNIRGRVLPSTVTPVILHAEMQDGSYIDGETAIADSPLPIKKIFLQSIDPSVTITAVEDALEAIRMADIILLGPGSVFTSILPNLLVPGISEAIQRTKVRKVYICNVMTQHGETDNYTASDHVQVLEEHTVPKLFDYVMVNTGIPEAQLLEKYSRTQARLVEPDIDRLKARGYKPITGDFIHESDVVRHDAGLLARAIMKMLR